MRGVESEINGIAGNIPVIHASSQATVESFHKPELLRVFEDRLLWSARRNTPWQPVVIGNGGLPNRGPYGRRRH